MARLIGHGRTMEMVYTGEMIDAQEAHRIGLVNHVTAPEELRDRTMALARSIGSKSAHTLRVAKSTIRAALETSLSDGVQVEADAFAKLFDTEDKEIGVNAFLAREPAVWKHR